MKKEVMIESESKTLQQKQKYSFTKGNFVTFSIEVQGGKSKHFKVNFESRK